MRNVLGFLSASGLIFLTACSETPPPGIPEPVAVTTSAEKSGVPVADEVTPGEPAQSEPVIDGNTGLAVGQKAPEFKLTDQTGTERTLDEYLDEGKVALVFYRSADW